MATSRQAEQQAGSDWIIDERTHAGAEHLDPDFVAGFDRKQGAVAAEEAAADAAVLGEHGVGEGSTVLDLAAGTGRFTLAAAPRFRRVVAVDVSPVMVEHLRGRVAAAGLSNVTAVQAGFLGYRHSGPPVDAVHTRHALHQLPDFWKALALERIARVLRPGGVLRLRDLVFDFRPDQADQVIGPWLDGAPDDPEAGYTRADLAEHLRLEFSTFRWLLEPMLDAAGFDIAEVSFRSRLFGAYTCVRR